MFGSVLPDLRLFAVQVEGHSASDDEIGEYDNDPGGNEGRLQLC